MDDLISNLTKLSSKTDEEEYKHLVDVIDNYATITNTELYNFINQNYYLIKRYNETFIIDMCEVTHKRAPLIRKYTNEFIRQFENKADILYLMDLSKFIFIMIKQEVDRDLNTREEDFFADDEEEIDDL